MRRNNRGGDRGIGVTGFSQVRGFVVSRAGTPA
jgi:hypothetical protein